MADDTIVFELVCGQETGIHLHALNMPGRAVIEFTRLQLFDREPYRDYITNTGGQLSFGCINGQWVYQVTQLGDRFILVNLIEGEPLNALPT